MVSHRRRFGTRARSCAADRPTTLTMSLRYRQVVGAVDPARPARPARDGPTNGFAYKKQVFLPETYRFMHKT